MPNRPTLPTETNFFVPNLIFYLKAIGNLRRPILGEEFKLKFLRMSIGKKKSGF